VDLGSKGSYIWDPFGLLAIDVAVRRLDMAIPPAAPPSGPQ
jgi:hypothetical protein